MNKKMRNKLCCYILAIACVMTMVFSVSTGTYASSEFAPIWPFTDYKTVNALDTYPSSEEAHSGIDIAAPEGTNVLSVEDGIVRRVYNGCHHRNNRGDSCDGKGWGNYVVVEKNGYVVIYAHLLKDCIYVHENQILKKGEVIGRSGTSGYSTGPHLHLTIYKGSWSTGFPEKKVRGEQTFLAFRDNNPSALDNVSFYVSLNSVFKTWFMYNCTHVSGNLYKYQYKQTETATSPSAETNTKNNDPSVKTYTVDVNSKVNENQLWNTDGIATFTVLLNNNVVARNVTDYYNTNVPIGTKVRIVDIKPNENYKYTGLVEINRYVMSNNSINLTFKKTEPAYTSVNMSYTSACYQNVYSSPDGTNYIGRIYINDRVTLTKLFSNGYAEVRVPWTGGTYRTCYCRLSEIQIMCLKYINAYDSENRYIGRAYKGDVLRDIVIQNDGNRIRCVCPWNKSTKVIWLQISDL